MNTADLDLRTDRYDLRALYETSRLLSSSLDLNFVLNNLLLTAMSKLFVTRGIALLFDPLTAKYTVASCKGIRALASGECLELGDFNKKDPIYKDDVPEVLKQKKK